MFQIVRIFAITLIKRQLVAFMKDATSKLFLNLKCATTLSVMFVFTTFEFTHILCDRLHLRPTLSTSILIPNFFSHFKLEQSTRDEYDTDLGLEYEDQELQKEFLYDI